VRPIRELRVSTDRPTAPIGGSSAAAEERNPAGSVDLAIWQQGAVRLQGKIGKFEPERRMAGLIRGGPQCPTKGFGARLCRARSARGSAVLFSNG